MQAASLGGKRVDETGRAMDDIMDSVRRVAEIFGEVTAASHEQRNGIEQVNKAVTQMDRTTQENAALVGEVAASSQALLDQAQRLGEVVSRFHLARDATPEPVAMPARQANGPPRWPPHASTMSVGSPPPSDAGPRRPGLHSRDSTTE